MEYDYVDDPNGERSCNSRWDHQFEKAINVNGSIICEACFKGISTPEIPVPKPGEPMPTAPPTVPPVEEPNPPVEEPNPPVEDTNPQE